MRINKKKQVSRKKIIPPKNEPGQNFNKYIPFVFFALILLLYSFVRIRLLSFPLERDEGEYAYFGQLILDGIPPFKLAYNLKLPGTYYMYAFIMGIFGQTSNGIHLGLMFFNIGSMVFLFFLSRKLFNDFIAVTATAVFAVLTISPSFLGQSAHATHFVTFFMLGGVFFLIRAFEKRKFYFYLLSGLFLGSSFLMKQSGIFFPVFGGLMIILNYFIKKESSLKQGVIHLLAFGMGVIIPLGVIFIIMAGSGVFERFWFWTFTYPQVYGSKIPLGNAFETLKINAVTLFRIFVPVWIVSALGFISLLIYPATKWSRIFLGFFVIFSILPAIPGFYFRPHYFLPLIPALGLTAGIALDTINKYSEKHFRNIRWVTAVFFIILIGTGLVKNKDYYFTAPVKNLVKKVFYGNPFSESVPIAQYIKSHTTPEDTIFVFGSEPQIYFLSQRKSATGYIYMYDLVFDHPYLKQMQDEMMEQVNKSKPDYVVLVRIPYSWLSQPEVSDTLFKWFNNFMLENKYSLSGIVELHTPDPSVIVWDDEARRYRKKSETYIVISKRGVE